MELNESHYRQIEKLLPRQRGNVKIDNRRMLQAIIYRCQNGCSWRALLPSFGPWHSIYMRLSRWAQSGVLERVYAALAAQGLQAAAICCLDSTAAKVHPDAHGGRKKTAGRP